MYCGDILVAEAGALERAEQIPRHVAELAERRHTAQLLDLHELPQEPWVDLRQVVERLRAPSAPQSPEERPHPPIVGHDQPFSERRLVLTVVGGVIRPGREEAPGLPDLERPYRLQERFLERAADGHRLPNRFHLRRQCPIRLRELLEIPARELDDDIVDRGLEGGGRQPRDVVGNFVEVIAERQLGGDLGNRESGRLRGERGRPRHPADSSRSRQRGRPQD